MAKKKKKSSGGLNTSYLTKMGFHNMVANRSMTFSSISVLTACLMLIGISVIILLNIHSLVNDVEKQNVVVAFVQDGADDATVAKVGADLLTIENVENVEFVSREAAYEEQLEKFGSSVEELQAHIDNPLPDSYRVTVKNLDEFGTTLQSIKSVANVMHVRESQELVTQISTLQKSITAICIMIVIVLAGVSMFIISNTIRMAMVSRKIDIQVMKSVGATNTFIRWPFMIEGIIIGLVSGVLALVLTVVVENVEGEALRNLLAMFGSKAVSLLDYIWVLVGSYLVAGITISSFGTLVSIRKYLRKEGSEANELI
ncbi:MAG: permease-like cell division protein FtsX [Clostridia bacterium]|nr:permease-like cell division protein FtsX [Clostridia bacterium]